MKIRWFFWLLMLLLALGTASGAALAQGEGGGWSEPINLSNTLTHSQFPAIAADPAGGVHVVWLESVSSTERALLYTSLENGNWSTSIDIVPDVAVGGQGVPSLLADVEGILHLAYLKNGGIAYTQAFAPQAGSAKAWREPVVVVPVQNDQGRFDLALGSGAAEGLLCLAHAQMIGPGSGVYVTCSQDGGLTWEPPYTVYANLDAGQIVNKPSLAIDSDGGLHVVWMFANYPETFPPRGLRYARSTDGGLTWRTMTLADGPYDDPAITLCAEPEVHVVWSGTADDRYRFHRWSVDYGANWFDTYRNLTGGGTLGYADLTCDSSMTLHWFTAVDDFTTRGTDINPQSLLHLTFLNGTWPSLDVILKDVIDFQNMANVSSATRLGRHLDVVVGVPLPLSQTTYRFEIYYLTRALEVPAWEPRRIENHQPIQTQDSPQAVDFIATADPPIVEGQMMVPDTAPWTAVSLGGGAALLAVLLVVAIQVKRARR